METRNRSLRQKMALTLFTGMILYFSSAGQAGSGSAENQPLLSRVYDTLITGNGYGNYKLSFSQWDPGLGELVAVRIKAQVTVQYGFTLRNVDSLPDTYTVTVGRKDTIGSEAMAKPYNHITTDSVGSFLLDTVGQESKAPYALLNRYDNTDSITDQLASFAGRGKVVFSFSPVTWSNVVSSNNSSYNYNATMRDTTRFSLTYIYKRALPVASLTHFTATRKEAGNIQLGWTILNETEGRQYEIEAGRDGQSFDRSGSVISSEPAGGTADYQNTYILPPGSTGDYYFRVRVIDSGGTITYSDIRKLTVDGELTGLKVFPNPATDFIQLAFGGRVSGNWQVEILAADGHPLQSNMYLDTKSARVNFYRKLPPGVYFVRATDSRTSRRYAGKFVVR
jgi:hypothetical protein